jgi:hypothetical protein
VARVGEEERRKRAVKESPFNSGGVQVVRIGAHLPMSTRRVVSWVGQLQQHLTAIGLVEGLADGAIVVREVNKSGEPLAHGFKRELTVKEARALSDALGSAACGVEAWQEKASGFNRVRVSRSETGEVRVTRRGQTRTMRRSKLRGRLRRDNGSRYFHRFCQACHTSDNHEHRWVAVDDPNRRKYEYRDPFAEICDACVDKLANIPEPRAQLIELKTKRAEP